MARQTITQQAPMPGSNLQLVPVAQYEAGKEFYRAHRQDHGPWYFSSSMQGRFDLPEPEGTCYLALTPAAAVREVLGARLSQSRRIPQSLVAGRIISRLSPGNSLALFGSTGPADLPSSYETSLADAATSLGLELYATGSRNLYTFATFTESD